jgi:hypothetical protein
MLNIDWKSVVYIEVEEHVADNKLYVEQKLHESSVKQRMIGSPELRDFWLVILNLKQPIRSEKAHIKW